MSEFRCAVVIPAAGQSRRFGAGDKLAQDVGGRPMILRTVELFTRRDDVMAIVVAAPPESLDEFKSRYGAQLGFHGARVVAGGRVERWETVRNALAEVPEDCTHIAVHDAARPATPQDLIDRVVSAAEKHGAVIPGVAVPDTIKRVGAATEDKSVDPLDAILGGGSGKPGTTVRPVQETVSREGLMMVQTPQVFRADLLRRAYAQANLDSTDDAQLVERLGEPVIVVEGDPRNLKITRPPDVELCRRILNLRGPVERESHKRF